MQKRKLWIGIVALAVVIAAVAAGFLLHDQQQLEEIRNEALLELERNVGQYDEQSIVLYETSKAKAEELAELYGAELRITENGRFATLTLPEGTTIRDVYAMDESLQYIDEMAADYQVKVSELETEEGEEAGDGERLPMRPQYSVSDSDYELQTYLDYLNMGSVWNNYKGSGITVAVIDTGIDTDHPEFVGRISEYSYNATEDKVVKDFLLEDGSYDWSLIEDEQGHGTAVTGVIAAAMDGNGIVGIAPNVEIVVIKAEAESCGKFKRASDLVFGIYYAIERDVRVINMSFGGYGYNFYEEALQLAYDSDIICVAAAGNDSTSALHYPSADRNVIGVGALAEDGWELAGYSNYGENLDMVAPGTTYTAAMGGGYKKVSGTSTATPIVTATIALFLQTGKYQTFDDVTEVLYASCYDLGDLGRDWDYGFGALDISAFILEERGKITYEMLTDELENMEGIYIQGHTLQELPEPERLYAVFDGWYYDDTFTQKYSYYEDAFYGEELTLYAKWANEDDGIPYTYVILDDGTVEIRSYTGHRRFITIPERIEGRIVSSIGDFAFSGQTRLREVGLPSGLRHIGRYAFENCANLVSMQIPANVTEIEEYAFTGNVRLSSIVFQGNSKLETIGDFAFKSCGKLERIELPASLTSINASAFYGDTALSSIQVQQGNTAFQSKEGVLFNLTGSTLVAFPAAHGSSYTLPAETRTIATYAFAFAKVKEIDLANVETIADAAFIYAALESLEIPDCVTSMGNSAFASNVNLSQLTIGRGLTQISAFAFERTALRELTIPNGITVIGRNAFAGSSLQSVSFEENSALTLIGATAFYGCNISEIDIPASVLEIGMEAFSGGMVGNPLTRVGFAENVALHTIGGGAFAKCWLLEEIQLPASLQIIGAQAFMSTALRQVTIPASVTSLGAGAFACCSDLTAITVEEGNAVYHDLDGVVHNLENTEIHAFPAGKEVDTYYIENTVRTIMPWSFAGAWRVNTVVLPEGLTEVGEYGFYLCGTYSYSLPSTLTHIMDYAFSKNYNITGITLPEALVQIAEYAFSECTKLQTIHIPDNVLQIGRYAFAYDWNLYSITFNETSELPRISFRAFAYCGIQSFTVPANVSTMAQGAFTGCQNLTSFTFAENSKLSSISAYMFDGCSNLQNITFEDGSALTSIQAHGLEGMDKLTTIDFGDAKLTNVDNFAFRFCESLSTLSLPETVTNIGRYAFYGCKSLAELNIPMLMEHIGSYAFLGTGDIDLYFAGETLPLYLDENWDYGTRGYYTGVAEVQESGNYRYAVLESGNIAILEYLGEETAVDLTTVALGAPITILGGSAFEDSTVTSIVLPDTLESIQAEAFAYSNLTAVTIPANVTFIGREAFAHTDIATLTFAGSSQLSVMEQYAFVGTKNLQTVTLPASLTTMGTGVFQQSGLTSVIFESGIQIGEIPQKAFAETKLTSLALPDSVTLVNHNAFNNVQTLKSVSFGNNEGIRLMSNAFYHTGLEELHIPANVTYIGEYCFVALNNLAEFSVDASNPNYKAEDGLLLNKSGRKLIAVPAGRTGSLTVPEGVEEVGFGAFEESKLSEIAFLADANILTFGYRAFFKANNITTISVPKSVVSIDYYAFAYCENLREVIFAEENQLKGIYEGAFLGCINLESITIPDSIVEISDFAFYGCSKIDALPISENNQIKGIYDYAFAYTGLNGEFTTPETLWDIGNYAFLGTKLTKVTIPDTNKKILVIGIGAFEDCNQMTEITVPFIGASYEDEEISWFGYIFGAGAYEANETYVPKSLKTVTITDGITTIYTGGFAYCTGVETINVPHSVSVLWNDAFRDTTAKYELSNKIITWWGVNRAVYPSVREGHFGEGISGELILSDIVTDIGWYAFGSCGSLTGIEIPNSVVTIGHSAFEGCVSLSNVVIPDGITNIDERTFCCCFSLETIVIPDSIESIGFMAFNGCENLMDVNIGSGVTIIGAEAFSGCTNLTSITIPSGVTSIGRDAFYPCNNLVHIVNLSKLEFVIGSENYGSVAKQALVIEDSDGNKVYPDSSYFETEEGYLFTCVEDVYTLCAYLGSEDTITLPIDINGNSYEMYMFRGARNVIVPDGVTYIGSYAFAGKTWSLGNTLKSIILPDSVTCIENNAFQHCTMLSTISIPGAVTSIGDRAFEDCSSLTDVVLSDGVNAIGSSTFNSCAKLTNITIPDSVISIGSDAFASCLKLENIAIPDSVISIGNGAFYGCHSLKRITIPNGVKSIGWEMFRSCINLEMVKLPDELTSIDGYAFYDCQSLTNIEIPSSVTVIGDSAFRRCLKLTYMELPYGVTVASGFDPHTQVEFVSKDSSCVEEKGILYSGDFSQILYVSSKVSGDVILPDGLLTIGDSVFANCNAITSVTIPDSVAYIENNAFSGCSSLASVVIPDSVTSIGASAFERCSSLTSVMIPDSVTSIGYCAFYGCSSLTSVMIPDSVTSIGGYAFCGCSSLTSVTIGNGVTSIGYCAFYGCSSLTSVMIPDSVTSIGGSAFNDCSGLASVTIGNGVTSIGDRAFSGCRGLTSITIPDSVTSIGDSAFQSCSSLTSVVIPDSVTSINRYTFCGCGNLTSITIPDSVTSIGDWAFSWCSNLVKVINNSQLTLTMGETGNGYVAYYAYVIIDGDGNKIYRDDTCCETEEGFLYIYSNDKYTLRAYLGTEETVMLPTDIDGNSYEIDGLSGAKTVIIPNGVTKIDEYAFCNCSTLTNIIIPDSVTEIRDMAFQGCSSLMSITIPDSVTKIGDMAFQGCRSLMSITIPDSVTKIGECAFSDCYSLITVTIGNGITSISNGTFLNCSNLNSMKCPNGLVSIGESAFYSCGALTSITIPDSVTHIGRRAFGYCHSLTNIALPDGITSISSGMFMGCRNLKSVAIPESVTSIAGDAFSGCEKLYMVADYYKNGILVIDGWLIDVDEDVEYLRGIKGVRGVAYDAFDNCNLLKNVPWCSQTQGLTNVETIYITEITSSTPYVQNTLTLKNIVICDSVGASDLRYCQELLRNVTGVTIYVEALEEDLRWDDNFPGWSNGNKVIYGDDWHYVNFYDENGQLISSEPCRNSQIIRLPVHEIASDDGNVYEIIGWDTDGDGEVDGIPATSVVDIEAKPVVIAKEKKYLVQFVDQVSGTVYHSVELPYGAAITAPANPQKQGHDFVRWSGLTDGMTVTGDMVIYAVWKHHGSGHEYAEPVWVEATCTEPGYNKHACTVCGEFYKTDETEPLGHAYGTAEVTATCTEQGYTQHTCSRCGDSYRDGFTQTKGHEYGAWTATVAPGCVTTGEGYRICDVCGAREDAVLPAKGHSFEIVRETEATCKENGQRHYRCGDCGMETTETLPMAAHQYRKEYAHMSFLEWLIRLLLDVLWGYEGDQPYYYRCQLCGHIQTKAETGGTQAGTASSACKHGESSWEILQEATCTFGAVEGHVCALCDAVFEMRVGEELGEHNYEAVVTEPTWESGGYTTYTCCVCGYSYQDDFTDPLPYVLGDVDGNGVVDTDDAIYLLYYTLFGEGSYPINQPCDFDGNGVVDTDDAIYLLYHTLFGDSMYPLN